MLGLQPTVGGGWHSHSKLLLHRMEQLVSLRGVGRRGGHGPPCASTVLGWRAASAGMSTLQTQHLAAALGSLFLPRRWLCSPLPLPGSPLRGPGALCLCLGGLSVGKP